MGNSCPIAKLIAHRKYRLRQLRVEIGGTCVKSKRQSCHQPIMQSYLSNPKKKELILKKFFTAHGFESKFTSVKKVAKGDEFGIL